MRSWPAGLLLAAGCAAALREPAQLSTAAPGGPSAAELLAAAEAAWARRPESAEVRRAERLFAEAASADPAGIGGLAGAVRARAWLVEHSRDHAERLALATAAVEAGQWCLRRAPDDPACDYWLAVGLGLQARERPATAAEGLKLMAAALKRAAAADPRLDLGGPHRVLALVLLRAPAWPLGPGDPEAALAEARAGAALAPDHPPNQSTLGEALIANDRSDEGRAALGRALDHGKGVVHVLAPLEALERAMARRDPALAAMTETVFSVKRACPSCGTSFPELDPRLFSYNSRHGWCRTCYGTGLRLSGFDEEQTGEEIWWNDWWEDETQACPACDGKRLNREALAVTFRGESIAGMSAHPISAAHAFFRSLQVAG
ncbi:MAG TPA: hypothetical protein VFI16_03830, partial [Anaeromyxobacteraceae bacterium]|nr:hypothetical protein [Anaeromyxobacteraceae bacterium]